MSFTDTPAGPSTKSEVATGAPASDTTDPIAAASPRFSAPRTGTIVVLLVLAALVLRLWELGERPLHHDESLDAWWSWLFRNGNYQSYDPVYHGPLRFYITAGLFDLFGESEAVARLFSALCGTAVVGLPWFLRRELGRAGVITAAVALTISPTMLYYSRFGREDAQMVFLTLLAMVLGLSYLRRPRTSTATALMFTLACSFAIKESTYLFGLLLAVYLIILLAAQFDAQHRVDRGLETDVDQLNPAFMNSAIVLATAGLIVAVVVGAAADELFAMIALYFAGLAALALLTALPRLRAAHISWQPVHAVAATASMLALAVTWALVTSSDSGSALEEGAVDTPIAAEWQLNVLMIVLGILLAIAGALILWGDEVSIDVGVEIRNGPMRPYAAALALAGLAIVANEFVEGESRRLIALVTIAVTAALLATIVTSLPKTNADNFEWPRLVRSVGAIGWLGWIVALTTFAVTWFLFFTVWGRVKGDWASGFTRAIDYWDSQQEVNRGGQPWYYYLYALPAYEWLFVGLAFVGGWRALRRPTMMSALFVWFAIGSLILYSYAGERMPWLIAHPLLPVLILAGIGVQHLWDKRDHGAMPAIATVLVACLLATTAVSIRASFPNGADSREILSQAGQATPHLTAALERLDNIDEIAMRELGRPATLAIGTENAWPYSWYLRDRDGVAWFSNDTGPPTDGSVDVIIVDNATINTADFPDYQPTLFAMRSWWVPTYNDAGPTGWLSYIRSRDLWEQGPNPDFFGVTEVDPTEVDSGIRATLGRLHDGVDASSRNWVGFAGADDAPLPQPIDPNAFVEADDGRDGCGSVDQWFMVHSRFAFTEAVVYPAPIAAMGPLACASDSLATS